MVPVLLRVKRPKEASELENIYIEYDQSGSIKKTKYVTKDEHIQNALNMFSIEEPKEKLNLFKSKNTDKNS